jgi:hypothetical protein
MITYSHLVPPFLRNNKLVLLIRKETHIFFLYIYGKEKQTMLNSFVLYLLVTKFAVVVVLCVPKDVKISFYSKFALMISYTKFIVLD